MTRRRSLGLKVVWTLAVLSSIAVVRSIGAPILRPFPEFVAQEGATYVGVLCLDEWVEDPTTPDAELTWEFPANTQLHLDLTSDRHLVVRPPTTDWEGVERILFSVCNPSGECAAQTVSFRVEGLPDDPIIEWIPDQVTGGEGPFPPLNLRLYGWDPDGAEGLTWSAQNGATFRAEIRDGVLSVSPPSEDWVGTDTILVALRDPTDRVASRAVRYVATKGVPVTITALGVEGFLIQRGATKILIDALVRDALPLTTSERRRLQEAVSPYDGVTLALTSHPHYDHFDPNYAVQFLLHSPATIFMSLDETIGALRAQAEFERVAPQVVGIPFADGSRVEFDVADVHVTAYGLHHTGPGDLPNLAFLIEIGGVKILHLGDASPDVAVEDLLRFFDWPGLRIDVVLASGRWLAVPGAHF